MGITYRVALSAGACWGECQRVVMYVNISSHESLLSHHGRHAVFQIETTVVLILSCIDILFKTVVCMSTVSCDVSMLGVFVCILVYISSESMS